MPVILKHWRNNWRNSCWKFVYQHLNRSRLWFQRICRSKCGSIWVESIELYSLLFLHSLPIFVKDQKLGIDIVSRASPDEDFECPVLPHGFRKSGGATLWLGQQLFAAWSRSRYIILINNCESTLKTNQGVQIKNMENEVSNTEELYKIGPVFGYSCTVFC